MSLVNRIMEEKAQKRRDDDMTNRQQEMLDKLEKAIMEKLEAIEARLDDHDRKLKILRRAVGGK